MSIGRMTAVWKQSRHKSSDLLLLLALADYADDLGYCWPAIETLAKKVRVSRSTIIRASARLGKSGELFIQHNRRHGNKYIVLLGLEDHEILAAMTTKLNMTPEKAKEQLHIIRQVNPKYQNETNQNDKYQNDTSEVSKLDTSEVAQVKLDPSITANEPSPIADPLPAVSAPHPDEQQQDPEPAKSKKAGRIPKALHNAIMEKIVLVMGYDRDTLTDSDWSSIRGVASQIGAAGATPEDVPKLHTYITEVRGPELGFSSFTEQALKKYWKDYAKQKPPEVNYSQGDPEYDENLRFLNHPVDVKLYQDRKRLEAMEAALNDAKQKPA